MNIEQIEEYYKIGKELQEIELEQIRKLKEEIKDNGISANNTGSI